MKIIQADCLEWMRKQPDNSVDLVIGSPPYAEKGLRYKGNRKVISTDEWVDWMLEVTKEAVRISSGWVLWVVNGSVKNGQYLPACEGLVWEWYKQGGESERSCIWHKNSLPSNRAWFINDWEFVLAFKKPNTRPLFNWKSVALPPKRDSTLAFSHRDSRGIRMSTKKSLPNKLARPRDVIRVTVGGGHMGHKLAHENEAPFPLKLAKHFVKVCSNPGDLVLDPFVGSGTTLHACNETERKGIGIDVRKSQVHLSKKRLKDVNMRKC
ncbi:MAG: hypothetical protein COA78_29575 [Blastopirellula sp.]|nr:MAG: hypothetical protein COA78_29575 [Blastopirellula sp.]